MASIFRLIKQDHDHTRSLLDQLVADPAQVTYDEKARKHLADWLIAAESRHEAAEELVLWPAVRRRVADGAALVEDGLGQERDARFMLDTLRFAQGDERRDLAAEFGEAARAHMTFEEQEILPRLRKTMLWPGGLMLGAKFRLAERLGPTRPHPKGPYRRFGLLTKGTLAAALDRARDKATGRTK